MLFSDALEVAIGLTFVFLLLSLIMTAVVELIEAGLKTRGKRLFDGIVELLADPKFPATGIAAAEAIYHHPMVQGLFRGSLAGAIKARHLPSYVPTRNFALALISQALDGKLNAAATNGSIPAQAAFSDRLHLAAQRIENEAVRRAVLQAVAVGGNDINKVRQHLENWYDSAMDRVSGGYKRRSQWWLLVLGLATALALNVNTLTIVESLAKNATVRRAVVADAEVARAAGSDASSAAPEEIMERIDRLGLPIGWTLAGQSALAEPFRAAPVLGTLQIVVGYLMTAFAITLGAPFWFDVLNRLMVIRATVKPHEKSREEGSEDRADRTAPSRMIVVGDPASTTAAAAPPPAADGPIDTDVYAEPPRSDERPFETTNDPALEDVGGQ